MFAFGFILSTSLGGNVSAYRTFRKYAERDGDIACTWAPVKHYFDRGERDPVALVPPPFYKRAVAINQAWPVLGQIRKFDAVMIHQFESLSLAAFRSLISSGPPIVAAQDNPPLIDPDNYPLYPKDRIKPHWKRSVRRAADVWTARRIRYFVTRSSWQADLLVKGCGIVSKRVKPIHIGMDLESWPKIQREVAPGRAPVRLLFIGENFDRKGGPQLLKVFANGLFPRMTLDLVTHEPPSSVPEGVTVHTDLFPGDSRIRQLYANADIFLLPTTADYSSYVCLEALSSGCPVIASRVGGIPEIVRHGRNGLLVEPGDMHGLREAIECLAGDPMKRTAMGAEGRRIAETDFNASRNVPRVLDVMKHAARVGRRLQS